MTYTDVFGSATLPPSEYGYASFTLATNATFVWPYNTDGSSYPVAKVMDIACDAGNEITLPDCTEVSTGEDFLIRNIGANVLIVKDATGVQVASVAVGAASYFYLTDNTSAAGVFGVIGFGVGTSTADASSLVGYGIKAVGASLNQAHPVQPTNTGITLSADHRAKLIVFTGGVATFPLDTAATLGDDYFTMFRNDGTGTATIDPAASELIDGMASMQVQPGESLMLICTGAKWYSVGYGRSTLYQFTQLTKDVSAGGTITLSATEAANKLITFIGNPSAAVEVVVPAVVAVYYTQSAISTTHTITLKTSAGSGVGIIQGARVIALCDGTNVVSAQSAVANTSVSLTDGSALVPSLFFATQTNTGLFKSGTQDVGVTIGGSAVAVFGSTGPQTTTIGPNSTQRHTLPAVPSDTVTLNAATQTLTNKTISGSNNTLSNIGNTSLTNSSITINGNSVSLGGSTTVTATATNALTIGTGLSGTSYNGSTPVTVAIDSTVATLTGTQTLTNKTLTSPSITSPTISDGTANGVAYLNGSKVLTSGSALTFDGAQLFINGITVGRGAGAISSNLAVGASALTANTTGTLNSAIGELSLQANTTGSSNTAVGLQALQANTTASNNTAVGYQAGYSNTTGSATTAIGYQALYAQTTPSTGRNTAVGFQSAISLTTGNQNTAIGTFAMNSFTTGDRNTALGEQALYGAAGATGTDNVAIGKSAASAVSTGSYNVAIGANAYINGTTGGYNVAVGADALRSNTTATDNTAVGWASLYSNTTGVSNVAMGNIALYSTTTGGYNTAVGHQALRSNTTASNNTAVGYQAGYSQTAANGVGGNTFFGGKAGYSTANELNTFVGESSGYFITTGAKNTILGRYSGNQDGLDIRTSNNVIVLSDGDGNANFIVRRNSAGGYFLAGPTKSDPSGANYYSTVSADGADVQLILQRTGTGTGWAGIGASGESAFVVYGQGLTSIPFRVKQTDGTVILKDGATAATGTGITFPGTQNASSNANTLDDYEEGTWTPSLSGSFGYSIRNAQYTKIGNTVTVCGGIIWSSNSSGSTSFAVTGLPFTVQDYRIGVALGYMAGMDNVGGKQLVATASLGTTSFDFWAINDNATPTNIDAANISSTGEIQFTLVYHTS